MSSQSRPPRGKYCRAWGCQRICRRLPEHGHLIFTLAEVGEKNLGKGRGRVRRVVLQTPEGNQVNLLAVSEASAQDVVHFVTRRWACQENQFKRGVERWGINQLDGRTVEPYPGDSTIPNPARARVERAMRLARAVEGDAMRRLQTLDVDDPKRGRRRVQSGGISGGSFA